MIYVLCVINNLFGGKFNLIEGGESMNQFCVGDYAVYPGHGVGAIEKSKKKHLGK